MDIVFFMKKPSFSHHFFLLSFSCLAGAFVWGFSFFTFLGESVSPDLLQTRVLGTSYFRDRDTAPSVPSYLRRYTPPLRTFQPPGVKSPSPEPFRSVAPAVSPSRKASECRDSDGGANYYKKGTTENNLEKKEDHCMNPTVLYEYFCTDQDEILFEAYECRASCRGGKCENAPALPREIFFRSETFEPLDEEYPYVLRDDRGAEGQEILHFTVENPSEEESYQVTGMYFKKDPSSTFTAEENVHFSIYSPEGFELTRSTMKDGSLYFYFPRRMMALRPQEKKSYVLRIFVHQMPTTMIGKTLILEVDKEKGVQGILAQTEERFPRKVENPSLSLRTETFTFQTGKNVRQDRQEKKEQQEREEALKEPGLQVRVREMVSGGVLSDQDGGKVILKLRLEAQDEPIVIRKIRLRDLFGGGRLRTDLILRAQDPSRKDRLGNFIVYGQGSYALGQVALTMREGGLSLDAGESRNIDIAIDKIHLLSFRYTGQPFKFQLDDRLNNQGIDVVLEENGQILLPPEEGWGEGISSERFFLREENPSF